METKKQQSHTDCVCCFCEGTESLRKVEITCTDLIGFEDISHTIGEKYRGSGLATTEAYSEEYIKVLHMCDFCFKLFSKCHGFEIESNLVFYDWDSNIENKHKEIINELVHELGLL